MNILGKETFIRMHEKNAAIACFFKSKTLCFPGFGFLFFKSGQIPIHQARNLLFN